MVNLNYAFGDDISTFSVELDTDYGLKIDNSGILLGLGGGFILNDDLATNEAAGGFIGKLNFRVPIVSSLHLKYSLGQVWPNEFSPREGGISHYFGLFILF